MREDYKNILAADIKVLEFWRKRYLGQAALVCLVVGFLCVMVFKCIADVRALVLFLLLIGGIAFVMIRELREALQTKGESLVFAKGKSLFENICFDFGAGIDDDDSVWGNWNYNQRDCGAVVLGDGFCLEEDYLYDIVSSKFIEIKSTVFKGILLTLDCHEGAQSLLNDMRFKQEIENFRKTLKARSVASTFMQNKIYIWFVSDGRLYHQFSLWKFNVFVSFVAKLEKILAHVSALQTLLDVDNKNC